MEVVIILFCGLLSVVTWLIWGILIGFVAFGAVAIPWAIWELFMYLTFNNIINAFAKLPSFIGWLFGFVLTLPFSLISTLVCIWAYIQTILIGVLTYNGNPNSEFCKTFIEDCVVPWEGSWPHSFVIIRYYYYHMQWLWGGAEPKTGWFFWQNGCGEGWFKGDFWWPVGQELPVPFICLKLILLALPYIVVFVVPLFPILWSILRPFVGGMALLPSASGNGDGRD